MSSVSFISIFLVAGFLFCLGIVGELGRARTSHLCKQRYKYNAGSLYIPRSVFKSHSLASSRNLGLVIVSEIKRSVFSQHHNKLQNWCKGSKSLGSLPVLSVPSLCYREKIHNYGQTKLVH